MWVGSILLNSNTLGIFHISIYEAVGLFFNQLDQRLFLFFLLLWHRWYSTLDDLLGADSPWGCSLRTFNPNSNFASILVHFRLLWSGIELLFLDFKDLFMILFSSLVVFRHESHFLCWWIHYFWLRDFDWNRFLYFWAELQFLWICVTLYIKFWLFCFFFWLRIFEISLFWTKWNIWWNLNWIYRLVRQLRRRDSLIYDRRHYLLWLLR